MDHYVGIDVSLDQSSVCVVDATGRIVREAKVASEPEALIGFLAGLDLRLARVGLEAGPLSQWLQAALVEAGFEAVLLETRHVKAALSAMIVKTDRKDARGIAQLLRMGWFRPVHCKSAPAQEVRALLVARKQLQAKMRDVELSLRGLLRGFGLKVGEISKGQFSARVRTLVAGHTMLERIAEAMLQAREALQKEFGKLHRAMLAIVRADAVCRRLMTVPGVGALVAVTFTSGVDAPERFARSKDPMGAIGSILLSGRVRVLNHPRGSDHASPLSSTLRTHCCPHRSQRDLRVPGTQPFNLGHHLPGSGRRREDVQACGAQRRHCRSPGARVPAQGESPRPDGAGLSHHPHPGSGAGRVLDPPHSAEGRDREP